MFLVKVQEIETKIQELKTWVEGLTLKEATIFDHVEDNPVLVPADPAPRKTRARITDGTMNASSIARKLSKEFGKTITRESVIKVGKQINAKSTYCERQHISRYSPESVNMIMNLYRSCNSL